MTEGETMSTEPYEFISPDEVLVEALAKLGHALALHSSSDDQSWRETMLASGVGHPDPFIRANLATTCSLRQLRVLAADDHVAVRAMCTENPFAIDEGIQLILANDDDATVLHALLDNTPTCRAAVEVLVRSRHFSVRFRLARSRIALDLLEHLTTDPHPRIADLARRNIRYLTRAYAKRNG